MKIHAKLQAMKYKIAYNTLLYINRNNTKTNQYKREGFEYLKGRVEKLPEDIAFKPQFTPKSSCIKAFNKIYVFISKSNLKKPKPERYDSLFHEIGHWLHFQNLPALKESNAIWQGVNMDKICKDVSQRAAYDSKEFVAEVFKWLIKGRKFDEYIMKLYKSLNGPQVK